ncbi:rab GTPase-activating protein 1 isoform X1 [Anopheles funestus]|uniref:rab GTPase-activating protein 1 isoform X1 n=1 Tax=Anopheles funestus TaxID=62324 RepID=UPI0020C6FDE6|nr:rab GTPase-activating protein 1 isoform X1 [Anopheles funestus]XP_049297657.1 rab GTPase-activating protein 1 isoform X1 [Anopheles funestus]XP_049297658.1 rab GTPase-activating protein 1 isoform X1 [Anopheles funestus]
MEKQSDWANISSSSTPIGEARTKQNVTASAASKQEGGVTGADANSTKPEKNTHPDSTSGNGGASPVQLVEPSAVGTTDPTVAPKSEDSLSIKSSDSVTTSGEYEIVPEAPSPGEDLVDSGVTPRPKQLASEPIRNTEPDGNAGSDIGADLAECIADAGEAEGKEGKETAKKRTEGKKLSAISPILNIEGNGNMMDLEKNMNEVIHELDEERTLSGASEPSSSNKATPVRSPEKRNTAESNSQTPQHGADGGGGAKKPPVPTTLRLGLQSMRANFTIGGGEGSTDTTPNALLSPEGIGRGVGQSVFYDCLDSSPLTEKKDDMKPVGGCGAAAAAGETDDELSDIDQDCTIFSGVTYLGASRINAPKSEREILQKVTEMNGGGVGGVGGSSTGTGSDSPLGLKVSVSVPTCSEGLVVLYDCESHAVVATYEVQRILFFARGPVGTTDQACFAFTWSHGESQETAVHQCHVFRCNIPEAVTQVSTCFAKAFQRVLPPSIPASMTTSLAESGVNVMLASVTSDTAGNPIQSPMFEFAVSLEIKEKERNGTYVTVPRDVKSSFRLRCKTDKELCITVRQLPSDRFPFLLIERCFGVLLSPGRIVRQADMQLLDMVDAKYVKPADVNPSAPGTGNSSTGANAACNSSNSSVTDPANPYQIKAEWKANAFEALNMETPKKALTVAVNLVINGIEEPVQFVIETSVAILSQSELRIVSNMFTNKRPLLLHFYLTLRKNGKGTWEVDSIDHSDEIVEAQASSTASSLSLNFSFKSWTFRNSGSVQSMQDFDDPSPTDYTSDGDEPLLSGTGEVSRICTTAQQDEWDVILKEWYQEGSAPEKRPKNLPNLVRMGIPEMLRGKVWQRLACVENRNEMFDSYRLLITKESSCETIIQRDINRTFPAHKSFKENGGTGQENLYKVSKAYAVYDTEVGYCQGLSFIAASLLLHMPEEEAFCVLVALMYNYGLRDMYKMGFESLYLRLYQLNRLMKDQLPDLYEHFVQMGVESHMFASQWFLTLFTARFPLYFVFYILDVFLLDGIPVLFQVALTLLSVCRKDLLELDFEGILKYFRVTLPKKCRSETQAQKLMKLSFECKVKKLKKYELEYLAKKEETERKEQELKQYKQRYGEERDKLQQEIGLLNEKIDSMAREDRKNVGIIQDYKRIIQRQEAENGKLHTMLDDLTKTISTCSKCTASIPQSSPLHKSYGKNFQQANTVNNNNEQQNHPLADQPDGGSSTGTGGGKHAGASAVIGGLGPLDPLVIASQRIRELELELAQTKLAQVEAECKNQDLHHQLNTTVTELQATRSSWQPWLSKTLNSIQEKVVTKRDVNPPAPTFHSYASTDGNIKNHSNTLPHVRNNNNKAALAQRHSLAQVNFSGTDCTTASDADGNGGDPQVLARAKYDSSVNILYKDARCNSLK